MLVLPQMVEVLSGSDNVKYYESKGYKFPRKLDKRGRAVVPKNSKILVNVNDLKNSSKSRVRVICDYCLEIVEKEYCQYNISKQKSITDKDCCKKCQSKKTADGRFRYKFDDVLREFNSINLKVLINEENYMCANQIIPYECITCNHRSKVALSNVLLGRGCEKCKRKTSSEKQRFTYEYVSSTFKENGCALLSKEYKNKDQILEYICTCGNIGHSRFNCFRKGRRCKSCTSKKRSEALKQPIDEVRDFFEMQGCKLISNSYSPKEKLEYICVCGNLDKKTFSKFKQGQRCNECATQKRREHFQFNIEEVIFMFERESCELITKDYRNCIQELDFICSCGNISTVTLAAFKMGVRCEICEENNNTIHRRDSGRARYTEEYIAWSKLVLQRDSHTCQCCGKRGDRLHAHHKDGYHWCKERRFDLDNGATLCSECHKGFHLIYGKANNTEAQYIEWLSNKDSLFLLSQGGKI